MKNLSLILMLTIASCGEEIPTDESEQKLTEDRTEEIARVEPNKTYSIALQSSSELPNCSEENQKQLVYVKNEKTFYSCEDEGWTEIVMNDDVKGKSKKESEGDELSVEVEQVGDNCSEGGLKVKHKNKINFICNGIAGDNGKDGLNGSNGKNGIDGTNGIDGLNGVDGSDGIDAASLAVFDSNSNKVGYLVDYDNNVIMLEDGSLVSIRWDTGKHWGALYMKQKRIAGCFYESVDCTGTCYAHSTDGYIEYVTKDWLYEGNGVTYKTTGNEVPTMEMKTMKSKMTQGQCSGGTYTNYYSIPITNEWTNENNVSFPLSGPLYFQKD